MKYLKSIQQLNYLIESKKAFMIVFVDPDQFMPAKSLLNYIFAHRITPVIDKSIFIWNLVNQDIYSKYNIIAFPQLNILEGQQSLMSFIGYNREQANLAIELLCKELSLGKLTKQLNKNMTRCTKGHQMGLIDQLQYQKYANGCFQCNICHKLSHFQKSRPTLHCEYCSYDVCAYCSYEDVLI